MFTDFALLCPGMLVSVWTLVMLMKKKSAIQRLLTVTLALSAVHILMSGIYLSPSTVHHIALINVVRQITGPVVLPFIIMYVRALCGKNVMNWLTPVWFVLVTSQAIAVILFAVLIGQPHADQFIHALRTGVGLEHFSGPVYAYYKTICVDGYDTLLLIQMTYATVAAAVLYRKNHYTLRDIREVWNRQSARIMALVDPAIIVLMFECGAMRLLGDRYLVEHYKLTAVLMFCVAATAHIVCYTCNMKRTAPDDTANDDEEERLPAAAPQHDACRLGPGTTVYTQMCQRFDKLMEQDRLYLYATITLDYAARKMNTSKSGLSAFVRQRYNMRFKEYVNRRRVEYAKALLLDKPEAILEYIAVQSGYLTTSAFCQNFVQYTGMPPRLWSMNQQYKNKKSEQPN
jgi:AraC-like DNA-binding protein